MKQILSILLCTLVILTSLRDAITFAQFYANRDYIADNLCINRLEPQILCSGKCYLVEQLDANEDHTQPNSSKKYKERVSEILFYHNITSIVLTPTILPIAKNIKPSSHLDFYWQEFVHDIFHPPQFC